ncbi:MAG: hypothetical protein IIT56_10380, partial [Bacteroidales bacterium]|nr:hypothetical protein [Bacteroidales bacterium]
DHTLVDLNPRPDEQSAAILRIEQAVSGACPGFVNDDRTAFARDDVAFVRLISGKQLVHDAVAVGIGYVSLKHKHNNHVFAKVNILFDKSAKLFSKKIVKKLSSAKNV